jgi:hypothetical protein
MESVRRIPQVEMKNYAPFGLGELLNVLVSLFLITPLQKTCFRGGGQGSPGKTLPDDPCQELPKIRNH